MVHGMKLLYLTLQGIAAAVFHPWFIIVLFLIYRMYKKNHLIRRQTIGVIKDHRFGQMIEGTLIGIITGIVGSSVMVLLGISIRISDAMVMLLPIALILSLINFRYLCFSYAGGLLGIGALLFPMIDLDVPGIMALVGILHLMESILIFFAGADESIPIVIRKNEKITGAYLMQKFWPIPFVLLTFQTMAQIPGGTLEMPEWWPLMKAAVEDPSTVLLYSIFPITAALGYGNIAISTTPERKARRTALGLMVYSIIVLVIAIFSPQRIWLQWIGIILMPLMHETLILKGQRQEEKVRPLFVLPERGVRVLEVLAEGHAEKIGIKRGDIIHKMNGIEIESYIHLQSILNDSPTFLWIEGIDVDDHKKEYEYQSYRKGIDELGIIPLPENPIITYDLSNMQHTGLMNILMRRRNKY